MKYHDLIYDVGLHQGEDTAFYLAKGFRVIAFEANPHLVKECSERFKRAIAAGTLTIVAGAIVDPASEAARIGVVRFYRNLSLTIWGTIDQAWMQRNVALGAPSEVIEVRAIDFRSSLLTYGIPYYMKIDIEGADGCCLEALRNFQERPQFVSIESEKVSFARLQQEIRLLTALGYRHFCAVQQADIHRAREPEPAREGIRTGRRFEIGSSGPFGRDLPGPWLTASSLEDRYRDIFHAYRYFGDASFIRRTAIGRKLLKFAERHSRRPLPGWYDTHARLGNSDLTRPSDERHRDRLSGPDCPERVDIPQ